MENWEKLLIDFDTYHTLCVAFDGRYPSKNIKRVLSDDADLSLKRWGQFAPEKWGHISPENRGLFAPEYGGLFGRILQFVQICTKKTLCYLTI